MVLHAIHQLINGYSSKQPLLRKSVQIAIPPKKHFRAQKQTKKWDHFNIFIDGWDEDKGYIPDIMKSKAGLLCIFWTFTASIHLHKNEAWIRTYIFCNITFVKSNTSNTLLKIAVPWVNTESLNVTKPIWLQFYITCNQSKVILKISTVPGLVIIEMAWNNRNLIVINAIIHLWKN